ncbi:MAG: sulfite exporter TauE/SafE family protein [Planctomycetes bacterium]|nr:sulfite exporter TauE/SafE family protein [Planctomycetota bacterium]
MTGLFDLDVQAYIGGPALFAALAAVGFVVGILTGLFGVGGAFLINPLLNVLLGISYTLATGSSMSYTIGAGAAGWARHLRLGNVAPKTMLILAGGAVCGTLLGGDLHQHLKTAFGPDRFTLIMHGLFVVMLVVVAVLTVKSPQEPTGWSLLQKIPVGPRITIRTASLRRISLPGLVAAGLLVGVFKGMLGIGGGVLFLPIMMLVVGLSMKQSVGTSLGVVLLSSVAGAIFYGSHGQANMWIIITLLAGSSFGVQIGVWLSGRLRVAKMKWMFALLVLATACMIAADFWGKLVKMT